MTSIKNLRIDEITVSHELQQRAYLNLQVIAEYTALIEDGEAEFPPVEVVEDAHEGKNWLVDGFHRLQAFKNAGFKEVSTVVTLGTRRDALLASIKANTKNGLQRSNADKNKAVVALLNDEEWRKWSNREIGAIAGVSHEFVRKKREEVDTANGTAQSVSRYMKNGKIFEQPVTHTSYPNPQTAIAEHGIENKYDNEPHQPDNTIQDVPSGYESPTTAKRFSKPIDEIDLLEDEEYSEGQENLADDFGTKIYQFSIELGREQFSKFKDEFPKIFETPSEDYLNAMIGFAESRKKFFGYDTPFEKGFFEERVEEIAACLNAFSDKKKFLIKTAKTHPTLKEMNEIIKKSLVFEDELDFKRCEKSLSQWEKIGIETHSRRYRLNSRLLKIMAILSEKLPSNHAARTEWELRQHTSQNCSDEEGEAQNEAI